MKSLVASLLMLAASVATAAPTASIVASRTSGPAPLYVFFDATGTVDSNSSVNPWNDLSYFFRFADNQAGTWIVSGEPKNDAKGGPLAGHVFDRPGTYRVGVRAKNRDLTVSDAFVTVTVTDPNQVYSGTNTVVISRDTDVAGSPAGAQQITNATGWPSFESDKRYLLRSGQDFSDFGGLSFNNVSNWQLGAFGSGGRPQVSIVNVGRNLSQEELTSGGVIHGLECHGILQDANTNHFLVYNNHLDSPGAFITISSAMLYYLDRGNVDRLSRGVAVVDNYVNGHGVADESLFHDGHGITGDGEAVFFAGNEVENTYQSNVRFWSTHKGLYAHNRLHHTTGLGAKLALKLHSHGPNDYTPPFRAGQRPRSDWIICRENDFGFDPSRTPPPGSVPFRNDWALSIGPEDPNNPDSSGHLCGHSIIESNHFRPNTVSGGARDSWNIVVDGLFLEGNTVASGHAGELYLDGRGGPYTTSRTGGHIQGAWTVVAPRAEPEPPGTDPGPDPDPDGIGRATFAWTRSASTDVTGQRLEVSGGDVSMSVSLAPSVQTYSTIELLPIGTYSWRIVSINPTGETTATGPAFMVMEDDPGPTPEPPAPATGLSVQVEIVE